MTHTGPYTNKQTEQHKKNTEHQDATDIQNKLVFAVSFPETVDVNEGEKIDFRGFIKSEFEPRSFNPIWLGKSIYMPN